MLRTVARSSAPARITIAFGAEAALVDAAVSQTVAAIRGKEPGAQKVTVVASNPEGGALIRDAGAPTLFGDSTILVVTGADSASDSPLSSTSTGLILRTSRGLGGGRAVGWCGFPSGARCLRWARLSRALWWRRNSVSP